MKYGNEANFRANLLMEIGKSRVHRVDSLSDADRGSQDAYLSLSKKDRELVRIRKTREDYIADKKRYDAETRRIRKVKGI